VTVGSLLGEAEYNARERKGFEQLYGDLFATYHYEMTCQRDADTHVRTTPTE
jgi:hypothetical protein